MDHNLYYNDSEYQYEEANYYEDNNQNYDCEYENEKENFPEGESQSEIDGDALLISLVRSYPYLYNKELTDFKDTMKKQNAWIEIGKIINMKVEECQSRWTRLRERYTREKKQIQEETTTGSGVSKRKSFEFFNNMQFLEPFVKRRRTVTNVQVKSPPPPVKYCNLQKNFSSCNRKETNFSNANAAIKQSSSNIINSEENRKASNEKGFILFPTNMTSLVSRTNLNDEKPNNLSSTNAVIQQSTIDDIDSVQHVRNTKSDFCSNMSDTSVSVENISDDTRNKGRQRIKWKGKSQQSDVLENAICKVTSLIESKYSSSSSSSVLKPEKEEDVTFCQLILSLLTKMPYDKNAEKKKEILRVMYDM